jgi:two-component system sensor histidine kinase BaeS
MQEAGCRAQGERARAVQGCVEAWVSDTSPGIAPDDLPHVFERFWRSEKSRNRQTRGSGIGVVLVKQLVEAHGGRVSVESKPEQGTTFRVVLPLKLPTG